MKFIRKLNKYVEDYLDEYDRQRKHKQPYKRPTHNLMCECRVCLPSIRVYCREIMG